MTNYHSRLRMPNTIISCPSCDGAAEFTPVTMKKILRKDFSYFDKSRNFVVVRMQNTSGSFYKAALYYAGLSENLENISDLPEGYTTSMWCLSECGPYYNSLPTELENKGSIRCTDCLIQKKHELCWPDDAYFQIEFKGEILWAYDRPTALKLLAYLESDTRHKAVEIYSGERWNVRNVEDLFLRQIPTHFKRAKARPEVVKRLKSILGITDT